MTAQERHTLAAVSSRMFVRCDVFRLWVTVGGEFHESVRRSAT